MELHFARRKDIIRAQREFDLTEERLRHERVTTSIQRQKAEVDEQIRILEMRKRALLEEQQSLIVKAALRGDRRS